MYSSKFSSWILVFRTCSVILLLYNAANNRRATLLYQNRISIAIISSPLKESERTHGSRHFLWAVHCAALNGSTQLQIRFCSKRRLSAKLPFLIYAIVFLSHARVTHKNKYETRRKLRRVYISKRWNMKLMHTIKWHLRVYHYLWVVSVHSIYKIGSYS